MTTPRASGGAMFERLRRLHQSIVDDVPKLKRGRVWCHTCGRTEAVDSAACLRSGWPKCCHATMSIDSPDERRKLAHPEER